MRAEKFDDAVSHGLSHCMKAVDFIVEGPEFIAFIELKDPENPDATESRKKQFFTKFRSAKLDSNLYYKYRDTFLYQWACDRLHKPICYWVIIAFSELTKKDLLHRTNALKNKLPLVGPKAGNWQRPIVNACTVYNIETWNQAQPDILLERIS